MLWPLEETLLRASPSCLERGDRGSGRSAVACQTAEPAQPRCPLAAIACALLAFLLTSPAWSQVSFEEVTTSLRAAHLGPSWGASWGDFTGDGRPDLYVGNHGAGPSLYWNLLDGTFLDVAPFLGFAEGGDVHGAAWADFDNDGDQDLIQIVGGAGGTEPLPNRLYVNELTSGGALEERAAALGVDYPLGRGRTPLWWDWNNDGLLDLLVTNADRAGAQMPSALFEQTGSGFSSVEEIPGDLNFGQLGDLSGDGSVDLAAYVAGIGYRIYDSGSLPLTDVTAYVGPSLPGLLSDAAIADFNGDLLPDVFFARGGGLCCDVVAVGDSQVKLHLRPGSYGAAEEIGIDFETAGAVSFEVGSWGLSKSMIFVGSGGVHPSSFSFTLSDSNPQHQGLFEHEPGTTAAVSIGYDTSSGVWQIRVLGDALDAIIEATQPIENLTFVDFEITSGARQERLYLQGAGGLEQAAVTGLDAFTDCTSVTAGDYDNDMDVDVYLVCKGLVENLPNLLYVNDGSGNFTPVPAAGGAEGSMLGRGESAATADYDLDGFLDLFVTNGEGAPPFADGPHQLFRNLGNDNHWLEVDLVGTASNRDGIGARLELSAGGVVQLREQVGGMHWRSQDHQRIHFGLGQNTVVDSLLVRWPSGETQLIEQIPADQVYVLVPEPSVVLSQVAAAAVLGIMLKLRTRQRKMRPVCDHLENASAA